MVFEPIDLKEDPRKAEDFILQASLSDARLTKFVDDYREDRAGSRTAEMLFESVGAYREDPERNDTFGFGFNVLLRKGPFVDGSNWFEYRTWTFAVAIQRNLFARFDDLLSPARSLLSHQQTADGVLQAIDALGERAGSAGYEPTVAILTGQIPTPLVTDLWQHESFVPDWEMDIPSKLWVAGQHNGIPLITMQESSLRGLYLVDLRRLAALTRYGDVEFDTTVIDEEQAQAILDNTKQTLTWDPGTPDTREEKLRQLQLHVGVRLYESFQLESLDTGAVFHSAIEE